ncbi:MAG TPA: SBBP repeat-containing protein, partial [Bacteroidia bacterium]|nr:SBBP repeat-containing protein [Bacteroidia bacterium]
MKKIKIITALLLIISSTYSQNWQWAKHAGGSGNDRVSSICNDVNGNLYIGGGANGTNCIFDTISLNCFYPTMILAKYNPNGNIVWLKKANGSNTGAYAKKIGIDGNGFIYVAGFFQGNGTFDTTTLTGYGNDDGFLAKY